jgi:hypothetical protein
LAHTGGKRKTILVTQRRILPQMILADFLSQRIIRWLEKRITPETVGTTG